MEHLNTPRTAKSNSFDPSKANPNSLISLQSVQIATPCRADWSKMQGDDRSRFCQTCAKSVYNLSAMTTAEAQALITEKEGNLCARIYRRADGTVITGDCPVGKTAPRRPFWGAMASILAAIGCGGLLSGCGSGASSASVMQQADRLEKMRAVPVLGAVVNKFSPVSVVAGGMSAPIPPKMGKIACPAPTATPRPEEDPEPTEAPSDSEGAPEMGAVALSSGA